VDSSQRLLFTALKYLNHGATQTFSCFGSVQLPNLEEEWRTKMNSKRFPSLEHLSLFFDSFAKHHLSNWSFVMLKQCKDQSFGSA
jgi:hypothetical protein